MDAPPPPPPPPLPSAGDVRAITDALVLAHHADALRPVLARVQAAALNGEVFCNFPAREVPYELRVVLQQQLRYIVLDLDSAWVRVAW